MSAFDEDSIEEVIEEADPELREEIDQHLREAYDELRKAGFDHQSRTQKHLKELQRKIDEKRDYESDEE
ncbi:hypothetical protein [Haloferax sp. Q22]|uniref:hypothetical protein n=1 Tax=Haloferax sp. (strain Q22) TaxID=1526048 RepID=UPI000AA51EE3|nr:hypothetical protein [Haloferax sp. Q22]